MTVHALKDARLPRVDAAPDPESRQSSPAVQRSRRLLAERCTSGARASRMLRRAIVDAGASNGSCARVLGVDRTVVDDWCDDEHAAALTLRDARLLPVGVQRTLLAAWGSELDEQSAPRVANVSPSAAALALTREVGELCGAVLEGEADGELDANEAERALKELADVERLIASTRAVLERKRGGR